MRVVNFDDKSFLVPVGIYSDLESARSMLLFPIKISNNIWGFNENFQGLKLLNIYYAFSPAILPLPPEIRMYYTIVREIDTSYISHIKELTDPFDLSGLLTESTTVGDKLGIIFGAYRKPVEGTVAVYSRRLNTSGGTRLYLSNSPKNPDSRNWKGKFQDPERLISPLFFLKNQTKFALSQGICRPSNNGVDIDVCVASQKPEYTNISDLAIKKQLKIFHSPSKKNLTYLYVVIPIVVLILIVIIVFIFNHRK